MDYYESYLSRQQNAHSIWVDCLYWSSYYYFVRNEGSSPVLILTEISPDTRMIYQDTNLIEVKPGETGYLIANRDSRFLRLLYRNKLGDIPNRITIWFQAKR